MAFRMVDAKLFDVLRVIFVMCVLSAARAPADDTIQVNPEGGSLLQQMFLPSALSRRLTRSSAESKPPEEASIWESNTEAIVCFVALLLILGVGQCHVMVCGRMKVDKMGYIIEGQDGVAEPVPPSRTAKYKPSRNLIALGLEFNTVTYNRFSDEAASAGDYATSEFWRRRMLASGLKGKLPHTALAKDKQGKLKDTRQVKFAAETRHEGLEAGLEHDGDNWKAAGIMPQRTVKIASTKKGLSKTVSALGLEFNMVTYQGMIEGSARAGDAATSNLWKKRMLASRPICEKARIASKKAEQISAGSTDQFKSETDVIGRREVVANQFEKHRRKVSHHMLAKRPGTGASPKTKLSKTMSALGLEFNPVTYRRMMEDAARAGDDTASEFWRKTMLGSRAHQKDSHGAPTPCQPGLVQDAEADFESEMSHARSEAASEFEERQAKVETLEASSSSRDMNLVFPADEDIEVAQSVMPSQRCPPPATPPPPAPPLCQCADVDALNPVPPPGLTFEPPIGVPPGLSLGALTAADLQTQVAPPPGLSLEAASADKLELPIGLPPGLSLGVMSVDDDTQLDGPCEQGLRETEEVKTEMEITHERAEAAIAFEGCRRQAAEPMPSSNKPSKTVSALGLEFNTVTYQTMIEHAAHAGDSAASQLWKKRLFVSGAQETLPEGAATWSQQEWMEAAVQLEERQIKAFEEQPALYEARMARFFQ